MERRRAKAAAKRRRRAVIFAVSLIAAAIAIVLLVTKVIISKGHYDEAMQLRANGRWEKAVAAFAEAGNYSDAAEQIKETYYQQAQECMTSGNYTQAYQLFLKIKSYKDVDSLLANDDNLAAAHDAVFSVGNYVTFGTYPQTSSGNDETPIEWLVLDRDGDNALLLSRYGLDAQPYNEEWVDITWETCTLRTWLNDDFINRAFTAEAQAAILLTDVDNSSSQGFDFTTVSKYAEKVTGGNDTQDKIFLLSYAEAKKYLDATYDDDSNTKSRIAPTAYAIAQGAYTSYSDKTADDEDAGWWWLRSPGSSQYSASIVRSDGSLYDHDVLDGLLCVRPALWVNLESGIF